MKTKKIILIILLIVVIAGVVAIIITTNKKSEGMIAKQEEKASQSTTDIVMQDNQYISQINDIWLNTEEYLGKTIEIEGFPMTNGTYTFVGRYGPGCCVGDGYAYMEYEYDEELDLTDEKDWIKVIGTIRQGQDEYGPYIYIEATNVEKLEIRGLDRVTT